MFHNWKNSLQKQLVKAQRFGITNFLLALLLLFLAHMTIGGLAIYHSYLNYEEAAIDVILDRVERDISFDNGTWDLSKYDANSLIPDKFRLYVFSADGYIVDRWRPISGFMDLSDLKYLLNFQDPQTVRSVANQDWRIYSLPILNSSDNVLGVVTVAYHSTSEQNLAGVDQRLRDTAHAIMGNLLINGNQIDTSAIVRRDIPFDISFQVVDQFNHLLIYNSNANSMNRIPGFIDPSYVRAEMDNTHAKKVKAARGTTTYLVKSRTLTSGDQALGVVIAAQSIANLYRILLIYAVTSFLASLLLTGLSWRLLSKVVATTRQQTLQAVTNYQKPLAFEEIKSIIFAKKNSLLQINGQEIKISYATNQYYLCLALFASPKKKWETDELIDKFGEEPSKNSWRKVYDTMAAINAKTAAIMEPKLILVSNKTYQINPALLPKLG